MEIKSNEYIYCLDILGPFKAFDTVNHVILLHELERYWISGNTLECFGNYLTCMSFVTCGVPQESVPGPLLFLIYVNDISESPKTVISDVCI